MKTRLGDKRRFRAAAVSICMISFLTGACFLRRSLDSYEGTPTTLLPAKVGDFDAIVPSVAGQAWITGHNTIFLDDRDPFVKGFSVL